MKKLFLLIACMAFFAQLNAQSKFTERNRVQDDTWKNSTVSTIYLSGNGEYAVGQSTATNTSYIWNKTTGEVRIINDTVNKLNAVSNNGIAVGVAKKPSTDPNVVITDPNAPVVYKNNEWHFLSLGGHIYEGFTSVATAITPDGKWAVGTVKKTGNEPQGSEGIRWNLEDDSYLLLPNSNKIEDQGRNSGGYPLAVSNDGNVIAGSTNGFMFGNKPTVWESEDGTSYTVSIYGAGDGLEFVKGEMLGVSPNGQYAVGYYNTTGDENENNAIILWTKGKGFKAIPYTKEDKDGKITYMTYQKGVSVTNDGAIIGTYSNTENISGGNFNGFYWTEEDGFKDLTEYFEEKGIPYANATDIGNIKRVSDDGLSFSGISNSPRPIRPWVATIGDLKGCYPQRDAKNIPVDTTISLFTNVDITALDLSKVTISPNPGNVMTSVTDNGRRLLITHDKLSYGTEYTVTVADGALTGVTGDIEWNFTTKEPVIISMLPENKAKNVILKTGITIFFGDELEFGDLTTVTITPEVGNVKVESIDSRGIYITHDKLAYDSTYTVTIPAAEVKGFINDITWSFTTIPDTRVPSELSNFYQYSLDELGGKPAGISPNGKYVVGSDGTNSFVWNEGAVSKVESKEAVLVSVSDEGIAVGLAVDSSIVDNDGIYQQSGVVYNDGEWYYLGVGDSLITDRGSDAKDISGDGKTVVGKAPVGTASFEGGTWDITDIADTIISKNYKNFNERDEWGQIASVSSDGKVMAGKMVDSTSSNIPALWVNGSQRSLGALKKDLLGFDTITSVTGEFRNVSPNGKYAAGDIIVEGKIGENEVSVSAAFRYSIDNKAYTLVYDTNDISLPFYTNVVNDKGEMAVYSTNGSVSNAYYWINDTTEYIGIDKYLGAKVQIPEDVESLGTITDMSANGQVLTGTGNLVGGEQIQWIIEIGSAYKYTPADKEEKVYVDAEISIEFNIPVTFDDFSISISPALDITPSIEGSKLTLKHEGLKHGETYTVTIDEESLHEISGDITWSFTTAPLPVKPIAKTFRPSNNQENVELDAEISVEFDRDITLAELAEQKIVIESSGDTVTGVSLSVVDNNKLVIAHDDLKGGKKYVVTIEAGAVIGVVETNTKITWSFTTKTVQSISDVELKNTKVYPNPSEGLVNILVEGKSTVTIMDVAGRIVDTFEINNDATYNFAQKGMYLIQIESNGKKAIHKVVIR